MKQLAEQYPRYGYLMLHELLRREGLVINRKRTYRIYCDLGLQVRTKRRKKLTRPRMPLEVPLSVNERWSLDFVHDQLADGRRIKILNIVDDYIFISDRTDSGSFETVHHNSSRINNNSIATTVVKSARILEYTIWYWLICFHSI